MACDTCHQFGPRDDSLDGSGHPTTGSNTSEYVYSSTGDHIAHGAGDPQSWGLNEPNSGLDESVLPATGRCSNCHGDTSGYTNSHTNGVKNLNNGGITGFGSGTGSFTGTRTCTTVDCHGGIETPVWGTPARPARAPQRQTTGSTRRTWRGRPMSPAAGCHGASAETAATRPLNGSLTTAGVGYSAGTCSTNPCHANGVWTAPVALACADCHQNHATYDYLGDGAGTRLPVSGLHAKTNLVDQTDADGARGGVRECHTATPTVATSRGRSRLND
jgi:hypothetical protein